MSSLVKFLRFLVILSVSVELLMPICSVSLASEISMEFFGASNHSCCGKKKDKDVQIEQDQPSSQNTKFGCDCGMYCCSNYRVKNENKLEFHLEKIGDIFYRNDYKSRLFEVKILKPPSLIS